MQFKHPEILWALFLLLIPILIHLFQLRRFQKTPFTNVAMLQKVVSESRKSNTLKKWLLLITRLLLLAALIIAFAQPFLANNAALREKEVVIYLDNSFSMQAKDNGLSLLQKAIQDVIRNFGDEASVSLFTNETTFRNVNIKNIQNSLLSMPYSHRQLTLNDIQIKAKTLFSNSNSSIKDLIVISDFQQRMFSEDQMDSSINKHCVIVRSQTNQNVAIDSVLLQTEVSGQSAIQVMLSGGGIDDDIPISLYNGEVLIAKSAAKFNDANKANVTFSIPSNEVIDGKVQVTDQSLVYDNHFFFNIDQRTKVNVLAISESDSDYLERLFTEDEFNFSKNGLKQIDYSVFDRQNVVVLDGLKTIPKSLQKVLQVFHSDGGTLIIVPSIQSDLETYNQFLQNFGGMRMLESLQGKNRITSISFQHPLFRNVFQKEVTNFQYPEVNQHFRLQTKLPQILGMQGSIPFLVGNEGLYIFSASLELTNTNFKNSPLIVPTFYNMGVSGLKNPEIYHTLGQRETIDVTAELLGDEILKVSKEGDEFIPQQQRFSNRIRVVFGENPTRAGIYSITGNGTRLRKISFNYPRDESRLDYLDVESSMSPNVYGTIASLSEHLKAESSISAYWKWFVILALLLALMEVIIQKFVS